MKMCEKAGAEYALGRLKALAEEIVATAKSLRENHPEEYESRERIGMLESVADDFLESVNRQT